MMLTLAVPAAAIKHGGDAGCLNESNLAINTIATVLLPYNYTLP